MADLTKAATGRAVAPRPSLTSVETSLVDEYYSGASVILEYGSGASTLLGAGLGTKTIFSVESDRHWTANMRRWFKENPTDSTVVVHYSDVGPTGHWGTPVNRAVSGKWYLYPLGVWERPDFIHPDVVMIDGRFRTACFLTTLMMIDREVDLIFDDYLPRPQYHFLERFSPLLEMRGRMARFRLVPGPVTRDHARALMAAVGQAG